MKIDLHLHSYDGFDCFVPPSEIVREAIEKGMDAICITNHDTFKPSMGVVEAGNNVGFPVFMGCEYSSSDGHLLIYGFYDEKYVNKTLRPAQEVIDHVQSKGGIVIPSHPYTRGNSFTLGDKLFSLKGLIALETVNSRQPLDANLMAEDARQSLGLEGTGGSDAHSLGGYGGAFTVFDKTIGNDQELVRELKKGKYKAEYHNNFKPINFSITDLA